MGGIEGKLRGNCIEGKLGGKCKKTGFLYYIKEFSGSVEAIYGK